MGRLRTSDQGSGLPVVAPRSGQTYGNSPQEFAESVGRISRKCRLFRRHTPPRCLRHRPPMQFKEGSPSAPTGVAQQVTSHCASDGLRTCIYRSTSGWLPQG